MADIFISYARADRDLIEKLATALEAEGNSVWWDRQLVGGAEFSEEIEKELAAAKTVIVAWSENSVKSRWVKDEAVAAADAHKLIPVSVDGTAAPMGFRQFHLIDVSNWGGKPESDGFQDLSRAVKSTLTGERQVAPLVAKASRADKLIKPVPLAVMGLAVVAIIFGALTLRGDDVAGSDHTDEIAKAAPSVFDDIKPASIAVLPFADLSPEGDQEYFADGIAEEILNVLAGLNALEVTSRTSAFAFKSQSELSVQDIAASLKVRHILEGSVRKAGEQIRITAQLIDAESDQHLWSETYDRALTAENVFAIQDEIAQAITAQLRSKLKVDIDLQREFVQSGGTSEIDAYEAYLKGRELFRNRNYVKLPLAIEALEQAVAADPAFARAWGGLAVAYSVSPDWAFFDRDYRALAKDAAERALEMDPENSMALTALGQNNLPKDFEVAVDYYKRATAADPKNTTALLWLSQAYSRLGYFDRALEAVSRCLNIDPNYPVCMYTRAEETMLAGRYEEAMALLSPLMATEHADTYNPFLAMVAQREQPLLLEFMLREVADHMPGDTRWIVADLTRALSDEDYD
ncbi:MAG: TIR domain-containing protein, partial [Marinicaulis sp.]|nr:TIR domain-containing protein [Marinicaulis sp.]